MTFHLRDVVCRFEHATALSVDAISVGKAPLTAILGRNGSGKSTLMRLLAREIHPNQGQVRLGENQVRKASARDFAQQVAHLPQHLPPAPGLSIRELCALGRFPWRGVLGVHGEQDHKIVVRSLDRVGLSQDADRLVDTLSGGERQRAWIAMLLAQEAPILLLDEPTSALDLVYQEATLELLRDLSAEGIRVVIVLHDLNLAVRYADQIIALRKGVPVFDGPSQDFMTRELLRAVYDIDMLIAEHPTTAKPYAIHA